MDLDRSFQSRLGANRSSSAANRDRSVRWFSTEPTLGRAANQLPLSDPRKQKMPLLNIVVMLIIVGVGLYLINRYIPMASSIKSILNVVVVVVVGVWLLKVFGLWDGLSSYRIR
jgi:hypothetical protein